MHTIRWVSHLILTKVCAAFAFVARHFKFIRCSLWRNWHVSHISCWNISITTIANSHSEPVILAMLIIDPCLAISALNSKAIGFPLGTQIWLGVWTWVRFWSFKRMRTDEIDFLIFEFFVNKIFGLCTKLWKLYFFLLNDKWRNRPFSFFVIPFSFFFNFIHLVISH